VQARIDKVIDDGLASQNALVRSIARPRIAAAATFCDRYALTVTAATFTVACDALPALTVPFDGGQVSGQAADGRTYTAAARLEGDTVVVTFAGEAGKQEVRYRSPAPGSFEVRKKIHVDQLDLDLTWHSTYGRP
jgi:hypothetical protein